MARKYRLDADTPRRKLPPIPREGCHRKAREIEYIRAKLINAEQGNFSSLSAADILAKSKEELRRDGEL